MSICVRLLSFLAIGGCGALAVTTPALGQAADAARIRAVAATDLDSIFAKWNSDSAPGCAVAVDQDGQAVLTRAYGMADLEHGIRNRAETVFEAGSVSKQFTAAAVLALVDAGKLTLDTDVRTILPELPDYGHVITVDRLLNHTSGLRDWGGIAGLAGWPRTTRVHTQNDVLAIVVKQKALNFEPGAESSYTNTGYNLLTEIVRRVSGKSLAQFSHETFFAPLGMTHTRWRDEYRRIVPGRAQAYEWQGDRYQQEMPFEDAYGNGGLLTTVGDLLIWNRALDSGKLGGFVTTKLSERSTLRDGRKLTYGRGLFNYTFRGTEEIAHAGSTAGYRAWLGRYPARRLSVALLCNAANADTGMGRKVAALFLGGSAAAAVSAKPLDGLFVDQASGMPLDDARYLANASKFVSKDRIELTGRDGNIAIFVRTAPVVAAAVKLDTYVGHYASEEVGATYDISAGPDGLVWRIRDRPDFTRTLEPIYRDAFQGEGVTFRFVRDADGRVTGLTVSVERARNVRFARLD
ncbi:serine hydrolase domain-containing protein [Sphingomonas psychrotolerans]|uniref:Serine hydrolase n=1 Tax=Sphingomonas psychrotolerans TaxID=1327635 RepID=A0A2K8MJC4_9SPHN|nr:serine hydrolase domain-containing protein [Sphingomonas psychrotolerans]ATY33978.1 serine hydrolase [Sphingomonas psychrotolerans]